MKKLENPDIYIRINSRIKREHTDKIKAMAKRKKLTEGEVLRTALDYYFNNNK